MECSLETIKMSFHAPVGMLQTWAYFHELVNPLSPITKMLGVVQVEKGSEDIYEAKKIQCIRIMDNNG